VSDVDLLQGAVRIRATLHRTREGVSFGDPKSVARRRTLNLPAFALQHLKEHRSRQDQERQTVGGEWNEHDLVFTTPLGTPLDNSNVRREFRKILAAVGLPMMCLHDLRHTCATLLVATGTHLKVVQEILGHSQIGVTADTYAHVAQPQRHEAAARLDAMLGHVSSPATLALVGVNLGVKSPDVTVTSDDFLQMCWEEVVSPVGIEPTTNRLRVCCSAN
jgi:integrase